MSTHSLAQRAAAEFIGSAFLLLGVLGSGIMATNLTDDVGLQLFQNAFATAGILAALIAAFSWVSGAHFNPAVSLLSRLLGEISTKTLGAYVGAQIAGAGLGAIAANVLFELPAIDFSERDRTGGNLVLSELIATVGLLVLIWGVVRSGKTQAVPLTVASYIGGAYYFTSSTAFANPAVTLARTLSDTFAGISPASVPGFLGAQFAGVLIALGIIRFVFDYRSD